MESTYFNDLAHYDLAINVALLWLNEEEDQEVLENEKVVISSRAGSKYPNEMERKAMILSSFAGILMNSIPFEDILKVYRYKPSVTQFCKTITVAAFAHKTKLESQTDSRRLWQGLNNITGYKTKPNSISGSSAPLPDELNAFYARFEQVTNNPLASAPAAHNSPIPTITASEVRLAFLKVNPRKATGSLVVHSEPARTSWQRYSRTSLTSPYSTPRSPPASRRPPSYWYQRRTRQRASMTTDQWP
ncbi:uncharacterized protein [Scyliorhinus torazame]